MFVALARRIRIDEIAAENEQPSAVQRLGVSRAPRLLRHGISECFPNSVDTIKPMPVRNSCSGLYHLTIRRLTTRSTSISV
jgi:hypothetical protein